METETEPKTGSKGNTTNESEKEPAPEQAKEKDVSNVDSDKVESRALDHTDRRVMVHNVLKFLRTKEVDKMTKSWLDTLEDPNSIKITKTRKPPTDNWVVLTLEHEDMVQPLIDHINNNNLKNRQGGALHASRGASRLERGERAQNRKRKGADGGSDDEDTKRRKLGIPKTNDEIRDSITPLWRQPYDRQLVVKQREMNRRCANKITQEMKAKFRTLEMEARRNHNRKAVPVYDWVKEKNSIKVEMILPSPKQTEYRNKCELDFGYRHELVDARPENAESKESMPDDDVDSNEAPEIKKIPSVGFRASGWSGGVSLPHCCQNIPPEFCAIADIVSEFLSTSPIPPYDSKTHRGLWRTLAIRTSQRTKECMLVIVHAPASGGAGAKDETDDYSSVFSSEKERLISMLTEKKLPDVKREYPLEPSNERKDEDAPSTSIVTQSCSLKISSIFFQEFDGLSTPSPDHPVQHAYGKQAIQEKLGKCIFQISPGAFFQVNTEGAEILYDLVVEKVREVSPNPAETLLLDVCCGTGTIGLTCMKEGIVGRVLGVDISEPAIEDAKVNAQLNGDSDSPCDKTTFLASRAEHALAKEIQQSRDSVSSIVAVVDPAREGLHADVIKTLRINKKIQRLVYVSCNPTGSLVKDAAVLCMPPTKKYPGQPFRPTGGQPVDMFPGTPHCEMVMTFDRTQEQP